MNQEIQKENILEKALKQYDPIEAEIVDIKSKCLLMKVNGAEDKENYELCKAAHIGVKAIVSKIEKKRTALKADSLDFGRKVDAKAKTLDKKAREAADHLLKQRSIVEDEKKRIEDEKKAKIIAEEERIKKEEADRIEKERKEKEAQLEKIRLEQEAKQKEINDQQRKIKEAQDKIEADKKAIQDEKDKIERDKQHAVDIEKAKKKAVEDEKERAKVEKEQAEALELEKLQKEKERIEAEEAEAERQEALLPDIYKLKELGEFLINVEMPEVKEDKAYELLKYIKLSLNELGKELVEAKL